MYGLIYTIFIFIKMQQYVVNIDEQRVWLWNVERHGPTYDAI